MDVRRRTLAAVATLILAGSFPSSAALGADVSSAQVIHSQGTARLTGADGSRPLALEVEYWSAPPRFRMRCRVDRALPPGVDFDLAFDGTRYQLVDHADEPARLFAAAGESARTGIVLEADGSEVRYRLSLSSGRDRLPVRVERLAGQAPSMTLDLLYSDVAGDAGNMLFPRALALDLSAGEGPALMAHGNVAMQTPRTEAAAGDTFTLAPQQR